MVANTGISNSFSSKTERLGILSKPHVGVIGIGALLVALVFLFSLMVFNTHRDFDAYHEDARAAIAENHKVIQSSMELLAQIDEDDRKEEQEKAASAGWSTDGD
jgi:hypothetical protein